MEDADLQSVCGCNGDCGLRRSVLPEFRHFKGLQERIGGAGDLYVGGHTYGNFIWRGIGARTVTGCKVVCGGCKWARKQRTKTEYYDSLHFFKTNV